MPTVILLDVSLSMGRLVLPVKTSPSSDVSTRRQLAISGINTLLDYLSLNCKLEFVSLVIFSSLYEQVVPFTRDYAEIRSALSKLDEYNKTSIENALMGVSSIITEEWGTSPQCQVWLITDGRAGVGGSNGEPNVLSSPNQPVFPRQLPYQLHIVCIAGSAEPALALTEPYFRRLVAKGSPSGSLYVPEGPLCESSVLQMFSTLSEHHYTSFTGTLRCGNLRCPVYVFPAPKDYDREHEAEHVKLSVSKDLEICGFLSIKDIANPPYISRHLVLPLPAASTKSDVNPTESSTSMKSELDSGGIEEKDIEKTPAFTVLLHGSLKVEQMTAIVQIGKDWYGMMYSYADSKKKSNLMLSIFNPGVDVLPWLGDLNRLTISSEFPTPPYGEEGSVDVSPFPVCPSDRRSYTQNCVVWIKNAGLHADIQKILRSARRLPEKQAHFYKELNRLRSAALSLGFYELLTALSQLLERECALLPSNVHPDAALQMSHVAAMLRRTDLATDASRPIAPLRTSFVAHD